MDSEAAQRIAALEAQVVALEEKISEMNGLLHHHRVQERVLRRKEQVLNATLDSAADGILAVDNKGRIIFSNRQFARMWHIPPDLAESGDDSELLQFVVEQLANPNEFVQKVNELYHSAEESSDRLIFKDGRIFDRHSLPLLLEEGRVGRVWTFRDATPRDRITPRPTAIQLREQTSQV